MVLHWGHGDPKQNSNSPALWISRLCQAARAQRWDCKANNEHLPSCWQRWRGWADHHPNAKHTWTQETLLPFLVCPKLPLHTVPSVSILLNPHFILKTDDSSKGTWKSELNMPHSNYDRSSYNWKKDPARNKKWKVSYLCKHLSVTFPPPLPEVQELMEGLGHPSPGGSHSRAQKPCWKPYTVPTFQHQCQSLEAAPQWQLNWQCN